MTLLAKRKQGFVFPLFTHKTKVKSKEEIRDARKEETIKTESAGKETCAEESRTEKTYTEENSTEEKSAYCKTTGEKEDGGKENRAVLETKNFFCKKAGFTEEICTEKNEENRIFKTCFQAGVCFDEL